MKTLLINTCTNRIIVAIADNSTIFSFCNEILENQMSNVIMTKIKECFDKSNMLPADIDQIMVAVGPGSYTGIRIGATIAKTLAWALNKKIIPISSLEMMASGYDNDSLLVPMINARRNCVFSGIYNNKLDSIMEDKYISLDELNKKLVDKKYILISDDVDNTDCVKVDFLKVINKHNSDKSVNPHSVNPNYLKKTEAEENLHD